MNTLATKITLSGEESIAFVNSLYRPSNECIQQSKEWLRLMEKNIVITETKDGFEAEIEDLDLSFLEKQHEDRKLSREFPFSVDPFSSSLPMSTSIVELEEEILQEINGLNSACRPNNDRNTKQVVLTKSKNHIPSEIKVTIDGEILSLAS